MAAAKNLRLHILKDRVIFEKAGDGACLVLRRNAADGKLYARVDGGPREVEGAQIIPLDAIFGIYHLLSGPYVALILDSDVVVSASGLDFRQATKVAIIPILTTSAVLSERKQKDEDRYLQLLHQALSTHRFYFSHTYDVTHTLQRVASLGAENTKPIWQRADERFFWNKEVVSELIMAKAHEWIVPMMNAHLEFRTNCSVGAKSFSLLFISRRSRFRQGCRFTTRGIDEEGNVANFVETEQALLCDDGSQTSFVQFRGSIPLKWEQHVCMRYNPKVHHGDSPVKSQDLAKKHFDEVTSRYGTPLICVNLVDKKKEQKELGIKYAEATKAYDSKRIRYIWFDFHAKTKKDYGNLSELVGEVNEDFKTQGYFCRSPDGSVTKQQKGAIRTNCMDNLDRTNVAQSLFARRSLLQQLGQLTASNDKDVLSSPYKEFEVVFKDVWANNADAMSIYYSGSGALKTDFTRTGKRTLKGMINDGINSATRYYLNNFLDGDKQDALDLMLGRYKPNPSGPSPFGANTEQETLSLLLTRILVLMVGVFSVLLVIRPEEKDMTTLLLAASSITLLMFGFIIYSLLTKGGNLGRKLVRRPKLLT